ncbi:MAG: hypothetical protein JWR01_2604 [Subtercola sp.]|nr:hypothetical protein [Subtercola sp.]
MASFSRTGSSARWKRPAARAFVALALTVAALGFSGAASAAALPAAHAAVAHTSAVESGSRLSVDVATGAVCLVAAVIAGFVRRRRTRSSRFGGGLLGVTDAMLQRDVESPGPSDQYQTESYLAEPFDRAEPAGRPDPPAAPGSVWSTGSPVRRRLPDSYQRHDRAWYENLARQLQDSERELRGGTADGTAELH